MNSFETYLSYLRSIGFTDAKGQEVDRINNDGNYEPGNLRITNRKGQMQNTRSNVFLSAFGKRLCLEQWATETGIQSSTIRRRLDLGWVTELALSKSVRPHHDYRRRTAQVRAPTGLGPNPPPHHALLGGASPRATSYV